MLTLRGRDDAERLRRELAAGPRRVLVIGAGFTGSEIASACRELGLPVTVTERAATPLAGALGGAIGAVAARLQREHGVDLRCGVSVTSLEGDDAGHVRRAHLDDGTTLEVDVAVVALGALRNTEWLRDSGPRARARGGWPATPGAGCSTCTASSPTTSSPRATSPARPHPLFGFEFLALEHWSNAVVQAEVAAHNMVHAESERRPYLHVPTFWSFQFGVSIKSVGVPTLGEEVVIVQGSTDERRFVARLRPPGAHRGRGHLRPGQVAGVLPGSDRTGRAVPAALPQRGAAGIAAGVAGRVPGPGGADRRPHDRPYRPLADRTGVDAHCRRAGRRR